VNEGEAKTQIPTEAEREASRLLYGTPEGRKPEVDPNKDRQKPAGEYVWIVQWTRRAEYRGTTNKGWKEQLREEGLDGWFRTDIYCTAPAAANLRREYEAFGDKHFFVIKVPLEIHNKMKADGRTGGNTTMNPWALPDGCEIIKFD
jgi:hypothetical protein